MTDTDTDTQLREQVRARYAAAAAAVTATGRNALTLVDAEQSCCGPAHNVSCGDRTGVVDGAAGEAFGAALYSAEEQDQLPAQALAASLGCGNPMIVAELRAG